MAVSSFKIEMELRTCIIGKRKALFHKWSDKSQIVGPEMAAGGHNGGALKLTVGIIEYEDGVVTECYPHEIKFTDDKFKEYCFKE